MTYPTDVTRYLHAIIKIGLGVVGSILTGFLIGLWVDRHYAFGGIGIFIGVILGVGIGFVWLVKMALSIQDYDDDHSE